MLLNYMTKNRKIRKHNYPFPRAYSNRYCLQSACDVTYFDSHHMRLALNRDTILPFSLEKKKRRYYR